MQVNFENAVTFFIEQFNAFKRFTQCVVFVVAQINFKMRFTTKKIMGYI